MWNGKSDLFQEQHVNVLYLLEILSSLQYVRYVYKLHNTTIPTIFKYFYKNIALLVNYANATNDMLNFISPLLCHIIYVIFKKHPFFTYIHRSFMYSNCRKITDLCMSKYHIYICVYIYKHHNLLS
jgi:hypothetical protein